MSIDFENFRDAMAPAAARIEARRQVLIAEMEEKERALAVAIVPCETLAGNEEPESGEWAVSTFQKQDSLPPIRSVDDLVSDESLVIPPEIISGFLHQGLKGVLGSSSKAKKTWILIDAAISVASGTDFIGLKTIKGRVLYINFEIPDSFSRSRFSRVMRAKGVEKCPLLDIWNLRGFAAPLNVLEKEVIRRLKDGSYVLIIIDPIYKTIGDRVENSTEGVAAVCNELERIAVQTGAAVLYAAHFSKGNQAGKEAIDRIAGSGVWGRDADSMLIMTAHEEKDCFSVETILRNLKELEPFVIRWNYPLMETVQELDPEKLKLMPGGKKKSRDPMEVLSIIKDSTSENPISIAQWAELSAIPRTTLNDYIREFRSKGLIKTIGGGNHSGQILTEKAAEMVRNYAR